jgi:hypothetical protein
MNRFLVVLLFLFISHYAQSKEISISLLTATNQDIANVVVYATPKQKQAEVKSPELAIMDQVNTQFLPHILAIQKDTLVRFPNSDSIKHHVYSFSPAKTFELQLYKELQADPLLFSNLGSVELGCNIHDWMLGYIFVVDTPYFGKTDISGNLTLDLPDGEYQIDVWHPRIQDKFSSLTKLVAMPRDSDISIVLESPLLPDVNQYENVTDEFSDYE